MKKASVRKAKLKSYRKTSVLIAVAIIVFIAINYSYIDRSLENVFLNTEQLHVDRIIDGDTIESNETSIRLLGINTPERGEFLYTEARDFLGNEVLNKTVELEYVGDRYDKYNRVLAYVLFDDVNINVRMVENGFANYYFYGSKDKYSDELLGAWKRCINNKINLCEPSVDKCGQCVDIDNAGNSIINNCSFQCNITSWQIKGEGREKFIFNTALQPGQKTGFALDLRNTGGSLFLSDDEGKLVGWKE